MDLDHFYVVRTLTVFGMRDPTCTIWEGFTLMDAASKTSALSMWLDCVEGESAYNGVLGVSAIRRTAHGWWSPAGTTNDTCPLLDPAEALAFPSPVLLVQLARSELTRYEVLYIPEPGVPDSSKGFESLVDAVAGCVGFPLELLGCRAWEADYAMFKDGEEVLWMETELTPAPALLAVPTEELLKTEWPRVRLNGNPPPLIHAR